MMVLACLANKNAIRMADNFLFSRYYDSSTDNDRFVIIYHLHIAIVQTVLSALIGLFAFRWSHYIFDISATKLGIWLVVGLVLNAKWLMDWAFNFHIFKSSNEKQFGIKFATIAIAQIFLRLIGVHQPVSWVEWIAYAIMVVASFYIHRLKFDNELTLMDIEPSRPSTISLNVKYNSIYIPSNN